MVITEATLADPDDPAEAADRLEIALQRIGDLAGRIQAAQAARPGELAGALAGEAGAAVGSTGGAMSPEVASDLAERLDGLIARLRDALETSATD